jgi:hypothetical protein
MTTKPPEGECEGLSGDGKLTYLHVRHYAAPSVSYNPALPRGQGRAATDGVVRLGGRVQ